MRISTGNGRSAPEHVLVASKALGRSLQKGEVVHHINGEKTDNRNSNLLICTQSYHRRLHDRMARFYQQEHFMKVAQFIPERSRHGGTRLSGVREDSFSSCWRFSGD